MTKFDSTRHVPLGQPVEKDVVFLLEDEDNDWLSLLRWFYPSADAERREFQHGYGLMRYEIPAGDIRSALGIRVTLNPLAGGEPKSATRSFSEKEVVLSFDEEIKSMEIGGLVYVPGTFAVTIHGYGRILLSLGGDQVLEQPVFGKTDLIKSIGLRGWIPWRLVFRPSPKERDCVLSRFNQTLEFVHRDPPDVGTLQLCFSDLRAMHPQSVSHAPTRSFFSYWNAPPRDILSCAGVVEVTREGQYEVRFQAGGRSRLRFGDIVNATRAAGVPMNTAVRLKPGWISYQYLVSMRTVTPQVPNPSFVVRATDTGEELPHLSPRKSLSALLQQATELGLGRITMGNFWVEDYSQTWGDIGESRSVGGGPLTIGGTVFPLGLGTHAESKITIRFPSRYHSLSGFCGIDSSAGPRGSAIFKIVGGNQALFESPVKRGGDPAMEFSVPVGGLSEVELTVLPTEDGKDKDHADWANLQLR